MGSPAPSSPSEKRNFERILKDLVSRHGGTPRICRSVSLLAGEMQQARARLAVGKKRQSDLENAVKSRPSKRRKAASPTGKIWGPCEVEELAGVQEEQARRAERCRKVLSMRQERLKVHLEKGTFPQGRKRPPKGVFLCFNISTANIQNSSTLEASSESSEDDE